MATLWAQLAKNEQKGAALTALGLSEEGVTAWMSMAYPPEGGGDYESFQKAAEAAGANGAPLASKETIASFAKARPGKTSSTSDLNGAASMHSDSHCAATTPTETTTN